MKEETYQKCLIFEDSRSNFELLERMVHSFHLDPIKFDVLEKALRFITLQPANLVIIDTDYIKEGTPGEVTSRIKTLNPQSLVVWVCAHEPEGETDPGGKPDIILIKPFGMMLFQQVLTPYIFSQSIPGDKGKNN